MLAYGFTGHVNGDGRQMVVADAHKDGVRLIVHTECLESAMLELKFEAGRADGGWLVPFPSMDVNWNNANAANAN